MDPQGELERLRRDLGALEAQAARLRSRLEQIERELRLQRAAEQRREEKPARPIEPPPLPPLPAEGSEAIQTPAPKRPEPAAPEFAPLREGEVAKVSGQAGATIPAAAPRAPIESAPNRTWEMTIGTYWLPRVGAFGMVIGIALLMYYASQYSTPGLRVAAGWTVCLIALIAGAVIERRCTALAAAQDAGYRAGARYITYARVLYSIGIAGSYIVTFAMHYVPYARIVESRPVGLFLLAGVVAVWAIVTQIRRSKVMGYLVTAMGHLTVFLALVTADELGDYSAAAVVLLSAGSALLLLWNRWYYVAAVGLAGSYVNLAAWLLQLRSDEVSVFWFAMGLLGANMLIYAMAELLSPESLRREEVPVWFRTGFVTANTASFFALGTLLVLSFEFTRDRHDAFDLAVAMLLLVIALVYYRVRAHDPVFNAYMTKAVAVATLGLAERYGQSQLTAWLAVEMVVLLISARRSGMVVTRLLAFGVAIIAIVQGAYSVVTREAIPYSDPNFTRSVFEAALAVLAFFVASVLYQRTDWALRSPKALRVGANTAYALWQLDLVAEPPAKYRHAVKPYRGLQFPYAYALGGFTLFLFSASTLPAYGHRTAVLAGFGLMVTVIAARIASSPVGLAAALTFIAALVQGTVEIGNKQTATPLAAAIVALLGTAAVRADRRLAGEQEGLHFHQLPPAPYVMYGVAAWLLGLAIAAGFDDLVRASAALTGAGAALALSMLVLHRRALATAATGLIVWGVFTWLLASGEARTNLWHAAAGIALVAGLGVDRFLASQRADEKLRVWGGVLVVAAWILVFRYFDALSVRSAHPYSGESQGIPRDWLPAIWVLSAFAFLAYGLVFRAVAAGSIAVIGAFLASSAIVGSSYDHVVSVQPLLGGYLTATAFWMACERLAVTWRARSPRLYEIGAPICVVLAVTLLVLMIYWTPALSPRWLTASWAVLAFALFGISLLFRQRYYRYAGLFVFFLLATARAFLVDVWQREGIARPLTFIGVGLVALLVGFGYIKAVAQIDSAKPKREEPPPADELSRS